MSAPRPWRIERNAAGNAEVIDAAGNVVTRVVCVYDTSGAPCAYTAMFDDDAELIIQAVNGMAPSDKGAFMEPGEMSEGFGRRLRDPWG
jgi:hypothetical protein